MRLLTLRTALVVLALVMLATTADAQRRRSRRARRAAAAAVTGPRLGGHLGYNFADAIDALTLGAQLSYPLTPRVDLYPSFDYYFVDPGSLWSFNADLKLRPPTRYGAFYVGGGLNISRASALGVSDTDAHVNLLGGLEARRGSLAPYVEAKWVVGEWFQLVGGLNFRLR